MKNDNLGSSNKDYRLPRLPRNVENGGKERRHNV